MDLKDAFNGAVVKTQTGAKKLEIDDKETKIHFKQDVSTILGSADAIRNEASILNVKPNFDRDGFFHMARVPMAVVDLWRSEGFDLFSPERSGLTQEAHQAELTRRLNGDWTRLNVSKYRRL